MIKNYLKIALRNLLRYKIFSFINIFGLAVGLACVVLILLWIVDEISYDRFHTRAKDIYRVVEMQKQGEEPFPVAVTPAPLAPELKSRYPEVQSATHMMAGWGLKVEAEDQVFYDQPVLLTDTDFFRIFDFRILQGELESALQDPNSVLLSESTARRYFGERNPLGKVIKLHDIEMTVTGVFTDVPSNSHLWFELVTPFEVLNELGWDLEEWGSNSYYTYILLQQGTDPQRFEEKITNLLTEKEVGYFVKLNLQPLLDIHLKSDFIADLGGHGRILYVNVFSLIALLILLIACINFMNLTTARSSLRAREVGLRKVVGAYRRHLIYQFLGESILLTLVALVLSLLLVELVLPYFNQLTAKELAVDFFQNGLLLGGLFLITLITALLAGSYPALLLSGYEPVRVLKGNLLRGKGSINFRKILVLIQFTLAIILICSTLVIYRQIVYIRNIDLGYQKDQIIYINTRFLDKDTEIMLQDEFRKNPHILGVTGSNQLPLHIGNSGYGVRWEGKPDDFKPLVHTLNVDYDFLSTFGMELKEGRDFSRSVASDSNAFLINEELARLIGRESMVGEKLAYYTPEYGTVIGVVKDFHFKNLHHKIEPLMIFLHPGGTGIIHLKLDGYNIPAAVDFIEKVWAEIVPDRRCLYTFLDQTYEGMYRSEMRMGIIFRYFSWLAIIISCLGLFGLATFMTQSRIREIGIRKVLGSSVPGLVGLLALELTRWVALANLLAWPVTFYLIGLWLRTFAYRIDLSPFYFIIAGSVALLIALLTVCLVTVRAASINPARILTYE